MKLAILSQYPLVKTNIQGGVESNTIELIEKLKEYKDLDIHLITSTKQIDEDLDIFNDGVNLHYLSSPMLPQLVTSLTIDQYKIKKKIYEIKPDLINAHMAAPIYGYPALRTKYPTIVTVHGITSEESKTWRGLSGNIKRIIYTKMERNVLKHSRYLSVVSPYVENKVKNNVNGDIRIIPNGVHEEFFNIQGDSNQHRLLNIGGIEPRKGLLNMIKAMVLIKEEIPDVELHIIGKIRKKSYYDLLNKYIQLYNLHRNVIFFGNVSKDILMREIGECSVFVFPSEEESQGIVLLEAMAAGKAIVATKRGGIPFIVDNGKTGIIVEYNDVKALKEGIISLFKDDELKRKFGDAGREKARSFNFDKIAAMYYNFYKDVFSQINKKDHITLLNSKKG